jgi:hypothetical protein
VPIILSPLPALAPLPSIIIAIAVGIASLDIAVAIGIARLGIRLPPLALPIIVIGVTRLVIRLSLSIPFPLPRVVASIFYRGIVVVEAVALEPLSSSSSSTISSFAPKGNSPSSSGSIKGVRVRI